MIPLDLESGKRLPSGGPHPAMPRWGSGLSALAEWLERYAVCDRTETMPGGQTVSRYSLGLFTPVEWVVTRGPGGGVTSVQYPDWYPAR